MHWFVCNDAKKTVRGHEIGGSALREGRFYLYATGRGPLFRAHWSFWNNLRWFEAAIHVGGEDSLIRFQLLFPALAFVGVGFGVPRSWLSWWMIEDRVFALKVGYVNSILRLLIAHADWAEDCGMTSYYRTQKPRKYTDLQLWPGLELTLRWPPVVRWIFGKEMREKEVLETKPIAFEMDGRRYDGTWTLERWHSERPFWPWEYRVSYASNIEVPHPPMFSGKGENSWDCGDDAIYGMGSRELTPAKAVGEYIKRVLEYRERYGMPSEVTA
jgi:hypothetical protein